MTILPPAHGEIRPRGDVRRSSMPECRESTEEGSLSQPRSRLLIALALSWPRRSSAARSAGSCPPVRSASAVPRRVRRHPDDPVRLGSGADRPREVRLRLDPRDALAPGSAHDVPRAGRLLGDAGEAAGLLLRARHPDPEADGQDHRHRADGGHAGLQAWASAPATSSRTSRTRSCKEDVSTDDVVRKLRGPQGHAGHDHDPPAGLRRADPDDDHARRDPDARRSPTPS